MGIGEEWKAFVESIGTWSDNLKDNFLLYVSVLISLWPTPEELTHRGESVNN